MSSKARRGVWRALILAGVAAAALAPCTASAAAQKLRLAIPSQDLDSALTEFARQTGQSLLYSPEAVRGRRAKALNGQYSPEEALRTMLDGSGRTVRATPSGAFLIGEAEPEVRAFRVAAAQVERVAAPVQGPAAPQSVAAPAAEPPIDNAVEEIVVTGTSIRGVAPVGSNLVSVNQEALRATGAQNVTGALQAVPALSGTTGQGTTSAFYQPSIHQLGASASNSTLVLIDGHRGPTGGTNHTFLDPNIVPGLMIERVEVLAEGASSVYGSDAVAGVINFITRRRFDGVLAEASIVARDGTLGYTTGLLAGQSWDRGWAVFAAEYQYQDNLKNRDRPFTHPDHRDEGGQNFLTRNCSPAAIQPGGAGNIFLSPTSPTSVANTAANYTCTNWDRTDLLGAETRANVMGKISIDLTDRLTVGFDALLAERRGKTVQGAGTIQATVFRTGPQANPFYVNPPGVLPGTAAGDRQVITWDATDLVGTARGLNYSDTAFVNFTAEYDIGGDWGFDFLASGGRDESTTRTTGNINTSVANLALNGTTNGGGSLTQESIPGTGVARTILPLTTANALDVWNPAGSNRTSQDVIARLLDNRNQLTNSTDYRQVRGSFSGPIFQLPGGAVQLAFGGEMLQTSLDQLVVRSNNSGPASQGSQQLFFEFRRKVYSAFSEVNVPIISPEMGSFIRSFDLSMAVRHDDYSDFGKTTNPKIGFNLDPIQGLRFRGNWSTSFVAPPLTIIGDRFGAFGTAGFTAQTNNVNVPVSAYPEVVQILPQCAGQAQCNIGSIQGIQNTTGDPNADAQKGKGWSLGFDTNPDLIPGLRTAFTYWTTSFEGGVTGPQLVNVINTASAQHLLTFYPNCATPAQIAAQTQGIPQTSSLPACTNYILHTLNSNWLNLYIAGIDYSIDYDHRTDMGTFSAGISGTEFTKFDQSFGSGARYDILNTAGNNGTFPSIKRRARAYVGYSNDNIVARLFVNHTGSFRNWSSNTIAPLTRDANGNPNGGGDKVKALTTFDLNLGYDFREGFLEGSNVSLSVVNIFDKEPPFYNSGSGYYSLAHNPFGRTFNLTFRARLN
jgi:iron complex outermembrane receptor protein